MFQNLLVIVVLLGHAVRTVLAHANAVAVAMAFHMHFGSADGNFSQFATAYAGTGAERGTQHRFAAVCGFER